MVRRPALVWVLLGFAALLFVGATGVTAGAETSPERPTAGTGDWRAVTHRLDPQRADGGAGGRAGGRAGGGPGGRDRSHPHRRRTGANGGERDAALPERPVGRSIGALVAVQRNLDTQQVALTFDDGPDAATPQILALLRAHGVKATFCVIGVNVQAHPDMVRAIAADGHTLCNHTWHHDQQLGTRGADAIRADLQRTSDEIHRAAPGARIRYFRHPAGNFTATSTAVASSLGMISIGWDVDPRDWDLHRHGRGGPLAQHIVDVVTGQCHPGAIVLSHDGGNDRSSTVAAYQALLPWLKARYQLVPMPV